MSAQRAVADLGDAQAGGVGGHEQRRGRAGLLAAAQDAGDFHTS